MKIPCIKCNQKLFNYIEPFLKQWGYSKQMLTPDWDNLPVLVINFNDKLGKYSNIGIDCINRKKRVLVSNVEEFLAKAAKLKNKHYYSEFTLKDLHSGMIVKLRDGSKRIVIETDKGLLFSGDDTYFFGRCLDNSMTCERTPAIDILEVYEVSEGSEISKILDPNNNSKLTLIWKRSNTITIQQIADKFKIPVNEIVIEGYVNNNSK